MFAKSKSKPTANLYEESAPMTSETANTLSRNGFLLDNNKPSIISEGFSLVGDVTAQGTLHVEGAIKGSIVTEVVIIGITGKVEGMIRCTSLQIKGDFVGDAHCEDLSVSGKARVRASITYETVSIQRGAFIEGELARAT